MSFFRKAKKVLSSKKYRENPNPKNLSQERMAALNIEHEEFHPLASWDEFIANPGTYLNGMIEGKFEE